MTDEEIEKLAAALWRQFPMQELARQMSDAFFNTPVKFDSGSVTGSPLAPTPAKP